jgi:hypothetical protein
MGEITNSYKVLAEKRYSMRLLERNRPTWKDIIKTDLKKCDMRSSTKFIWLRIGFNEGFM